MNLHDLSCLLRSLELMTPRQRRSFFDLATIRQLRIMEQACFNLLKNPRGLTKTQLLVAQNYANYIKFLARQHNTLNSKKRLLIQKGGFLNILLPLLSTVVSAALSR